MASSGLHGDTEQTARRRSRSQRRGASKSASSSRCSKSTVDTGPARGHVEQRLVESVPRDRVDDFIRPLAIGLQRVRPPVDG